MYCVYWMEGFDPKCRETDSLKEALSICEGMRKEGWRFVTLVSENPDSVGKPGVDVTGPDYNWTKRRTTALRFPKE